MNLEPIEIDGKQYYLPLTEQLYRNEPELKSPDKGDWYVYYHIWDYSSGKWIPQKFYSSVLNKKELLTNIKQRKNNGKYVCNAVYTSLKNGINPKTGIAISPFLDKSAEEILAEANNDSPIPLVKLAVEKWIKIKSGKDNPNKDAPENKENTEVTYTSFFNMFLAFCDKNNLSTMRIDKVPKHMVHKFFEERYNKGTIGDLTWNVQLGYIKGLFSYYAKLYDYKNNIANIEDKEVIDDSERFEPFTPEQIVKIFKHLDSEQVIQYHKYKRTVPPNKLLAYTARTIYYTFIRVSELRRIKIKNIKRYKEGFFTLSAGIQKTKKKLFNDLYLDPKLVMEFEKLGWEKYFKDKKYENYYVFTKDMIPSPNKEGAYGFSKSFRTVLEYLGLDDESKFSLYSLKASGNIDAYNSGWDLFQISIQNRHTTTKQTETYLRKLKCNIAERPRPERKAF